MATWRCWLAANMALFKLASSPPDPDCLLSLRPVIMNTKTTIFCAAVALLALLVTLPQVHGECCGTWWTCLEKPYGTKRLYFKVNRCADCTEPSYWYCAKGKGGCNMFGCNCEGGCKRTVVGRTCRDKNNLCNVFPDDRKDREERDVTTMAHFEPVLWGNYTGHDVIGMGDHDKDGRLNGTEVRALLERMRVAGDDDAWRHLDVDLDGQLTAHEIDASLAPQHLELVVVDWP